MSEDKKEVERPKLEVIARNLANVDDDHKVHQIMPSVINAFLNSDGVKYTDDNGIESYKTNFSEAEAEKVADSVYDALLNHVAFRNYNGLTKDKLKDLKGVKDKHGNYQADLMVGQYFNLSRQQLRSQFKANRKKLTHDTLVKLLEDPIEHHINYHSSQIMKDLKPEHLEHIKDFINYHIKEKGLDKDIYNVSEAHEIKDVLTPFIKISGAHFKHYKPPVKKAT